MNVLILNGSPRPQGNTAKMINAFRESAENKGHEVRVYDVCRKNIHGCLACEHCHKIEHGICAQKDDMLEVYELLKDADVIHHCFHDLSKPVKDKEKARYDSLCREFGLKEV